MKTNFSLAEVLNYSVPAADILSVAAHMAKCQLGYGIIARSEPCFRAPKTTAAEYALLFGHDLANVCKVTCVTNARAYAYEKNVNKLTETTFTASQRSGFETIIDPIIIRSLKDGEYSVSITYKDKDTTKFVSTYAASDHAMTEEEITWIKAHLYIAPKSRKQSEAGVAEEEIINVRNYKFPRIIAVGTTSEVENIWKLLPITK